MKQKSHSKAKTIVKRKTFVGTIVSTKQTNTVNVLIVRFVQHPKYEKALKRTNTVSAHNDKLKLVVGDTVRIEACRPLSKMKHFIVVEKV